jgi:hypothetical protein
MHSSTFYDYLEYGGVQHNPVPKFIKELRGDARDWTIDIYDHITPDELKSAYFKHIPQLGLSP